MKKMFKAVLAAAVMGGVLGGVSYAAVDGLESAAGEIAGAARSGDSARANALLEKLFAGGISHEAAEPVRLELRASANKPAVARPAASLKSAPMPELPEMVKSADPEIKPTAVEGGKEGGKESASGKEKPSSAQWDFASLQEVNDYKAEFGGGASAGGTAASVVGGSLSLVVGAAVVVGLIVMFPPAALLVL